MILPDDLIIKKNCSKSMIKIHNINKASVMASMNVNKENVLSRMKHQLSDSKKIKLADFIIENITLNEFYSQAAEILQKLKK